METLDPGNWRSRCAKRFNEIDSDLTADEVDELAGEVYAFERTRAMLPEDAADFVAREMSRPDLPRFERRATPR